MERRPRGERGRREERGQSSVIGVVLILGLVIASMSVIATVGGLALLDTEDELSVSRAEKVMTQFDSQSALVALGETNARQTQLASGNAGEYTLDEDAGWMRISIRNTSSNTTEQVTNTSLGSLTYETDGTRLAYQGGGVWEKGDGDAVMVSPPEFHYRDRTLTLPVINVTGDDQVSGKVTVRQGGISQEYPNETFVNPVPAEREVIVTVKSEYYRGWGSYFERRTDGDVSYDDANRTATINLVVPIEERFDNAITATGNVNVSSGGNGNGNSGGPGGIEGDYVEGASRPSANSIVEKKINECESGGGCNTFTSTSNFDNGTYYRDGNVDFGSSTTFNTTDGNIEIVVDGTVTFGGDSGAGNEDHGITGDGNVTIYTNGTLSLNGNAGVNSDGDAADLLTYVHSSVDDIELKGTDQYRGLIYAPNSDLTISGGGKCKNGKNACNGNVVGSVVTNDANVGSGKVRQVEDMDINIEFASDAAITYLHISTNEIEINDG